MKRHKHSLSHYKLATMDMGELVPVSCYPVLPGDTIQMSSACLLRCSPLLAPVMHPVTVRLHHWFVPNRLTWVGWEDFITGGADGEGGSSGAFPTIDVGGSGATAGSLLDYLGVPPGVADLEVSALPARAYGMIFNEYYRDQDLVTARTVSTAAGADSTTDITLANIAWEKDYFTAARPWTQKGPEVTLPLGTSAPIHSPGAIGANNSVWSDGSNAIASLYDDAPNSANTIKMSSTGASTATWMYADLSNATAASVNDIREAFALQRYQEARALYGSRFTEYLRYLGIRSSDARLQRPEYLGGGKQTIAFSEVLQTGVTTDGDDSEGVGNLKGHGISAMRSRRFRRFFEEHGFVITLMSVRPRSMYSDGLHREWLKRTKEDFWQKELELIGQQEIQNQEVYAAAAVPSDVFGYQDRYSEYRKIPSGIAADFRSTLDFWHLARLFASEPSLNASFVTCTPSKRINAVQTDDVLWCMVNHSVQARRLVRTTSVGRII